MSPYALILDDHPLVARGVAEFLRSRLPHMEVAVAEHADDVAPLIEALGAPAIALIDFWLADGAALSLIARIRTRCPATAVAVMSGDDDLAVIDQVRAAGAHGFIHKQEPPETFAQAIEALLGGLAWFTPGANTQRPVRSRELPVTPAELGLSVRQGEILALVLQGQPNKRIAQQYALSESTVKEHMTAILQRLGARTRVEAITRLRGRLLVLPQQPPPP
ncbi:LuxR family transcriptional regulator [Acidovorax sp. Root275]|uniref:response regulator transcription factor n=1 Tax=Acidovorax sp. Root275 TaxID=1736508 RepID=UPI00070F7658|nr:response regulator transcription factor [Acidovorax sp. Root275]KRD47785.1 LuxR family transcriptional regulator [Acidovorax sp. Root275]